MEQEKIQPEQNQTAKPVKGKQKKAVPTSTSEPVQQTTQAPSTTEQASEGSKTSEDSKAPAENVAPATEDKKPVVVKQAPKKKDEAVARGVSLPISKKHSMYICTFIKNKRVETAIEDLEQVLKFKKAVPYKGEIPHRHGMMSGRYPINAAKEFIAVLKGLKGNIIVAGLAPEKTRIYSASASWASRSQKKGGARFKRTHIVITAREVGAKK